MVEYWMSGNGKFVAERTVLVRNTTGYFAGLRKTGCNDNCWDRGMGAPNYERMVRLIYKI